MNRTIRTLDLAGITTLLQWAAAEDWNPGLDDAAAFQSTDRSGFLGAYVDDVMVAGVAAVAYDQDFGFIGLYICHPDWRGQGHGKAVWDAGMAYLGNRTIGLDGVPEQQANYARMGFVPAYETVRMSGTLPARLAIDPSTAPTLEDIRALDRRCFPVQRDAFLRHWLALPNRAAVHRTDAAVTGYAVARKCMEGTKIGPLFAADLATAMELLTAQSGPIQIDVPASQSAWLQALSDLGFTAGFRTRRMYRGPQPDIQLTHVFGVTTLELG